MAKIPIALQVYSVRDDAARDLSHVLKEVARMGYDGVEFAGYYGHSASDIKKQLDDLGLKVCGAHTGIDQLLGDALPATIEFNQILGNPNLIVPWLGGEYSSSKEGWLKAAHTLNDLSDKLKPHGMRTGYHNHTMEFHPLDGELPWDIFFGNTRPEVIMQFDTGNALHAGAEAGPFLRKYPGRATTVHLKEFDPENEKVLIGEGKVDWNEIFSLCESVGGTEWYIVEQEAYPTTPLEGVEKCLQYLRSIGK